MKIKTEHRYKRITRILRRMGCVLMVGALLCTNAMPAWGTSVSKTEKEKKEAQQKLDSAKQKAEEAEQKKNAAQTQVAKLDSELANLLGVIQVLEGDIESKGEEIKRAQSDFDKAKAQEEKQYEAMKKRIRFMYEKGDTEYLEILLQVKSMSELLNKAEYVQELYKYDKKMLLVYRDTKEEVKNLQTQLEEDQAELEVMEAEYKGQQAELETMISKKRKEVSDFDSELAQAKKDAAVYAKAVEEKTQQLKKAQEAARKKAEEDRKKAEAQAKAQAAQRTAATNAPKNGKSNANNQYTGPAAAKSSGGTAQGRAVADYGLQFVGNKYVYGGTSLTNGTDCSGFTQSVYKHFGISIPRTSSAQASAGRAVAYDDMQPGDLVCYAGHVGLYIGNGQIVHASSAKTGIKVSNVGYRTILAIRRVL